MLKKPQELTNHSPLISKRSLLCLQPFCHLHNAADVHREIGLPLRDCPVHNPSGEVTDKCSILTKPYTVETPCDTTQYVIMYVTIPS